MLAGVFYCRVTVVMTISFFFFFQSSVSNWCTPYRFLHHNLIRKIENIDHLQFLDNLNLSHNSISKVENLSECRLLLFLCALLNTQRILWYVNTPSYAMSTQTHNACCKHTSHMHACAHNVRGRGGDFILVEIEGMPYRRILKLRLNFRVILVWLMHVDCSIRVFW